MAEKKPHYNMGGGLPPAEPAGRDIRQQDLVVPSAPPLSLEERKRIHQEFLMMGVSQWKPK